MTDDGSRVDCPEPYCGVALPEVSEIEAHLRWDHNRTKREAKEMISDE